MAEENATIMVLKVDLKCCKCYRKVKKVLCKFPQIRDQVYDEKNDTVTIKVVCCSPEKIKQEIICKGGDCIKGIEIIVPQKKSKQNKLKECGKIKEDEKRKEADKTKKSEESKKQEKTKLVMPPINLQYVGVRCKQCYIGYPGGPCFHGYGEPVKLEELAPPPPPPPPDTVSPPVGFCCQECYDGYPGGPCFHGCGEPEEPQKAQPAPAPAQVPVPGYPPPMGACCQQCYDGYPGGPCFHGHGGPPPCYQYNGYGGRPVYGSYGGGRSHYVSRCDYLSEENPSGCTIM